LILIDYLIIRKNFNKYSGAKFKTYPDFIGDAKDQRSHLNWCLLWLDECYRILKRHGVICVFSDWRQLPLTTDAVQMSGFIWRGITVWDKTEATRPQLGKALGKTQPERVIKAPVIPGVLRHMVKPKEKLHLTGKPIELMRRVVKITEQGEKIIDPFAGSGSTLAAGIMEGYPVQGCEIEPAYHEIATNRLLDLKQELITD